jgi:hypothetical protein
MENERDFLENPSRSRSNSIHSSKNLRADREEILFARNQRKF